MNYADISDICIAFKIANVISDEMSFIFSNIIIFHTTDQDISAILEYLK